MATNPEMTPEALAERHARLNRWRRKLTSPRDRLAAWLDMIFIDHAFFRMVYLNHHEVAPGIWRSAQPLPYQITRMAKRGLKTVVNLRGGQSYGSLPLEVEACERHGIQFETFVLRSRAIPSIEDVRATKELFERIQKPVLFHCKSGADRAGMMAALYLALVEGRPVSEARRQLSLRYGHFSRGPTGVLDAFFDTYEADQPDGAMPLMEWVETRFDEGAITQAFKAGTLGSFLTETVLRRE
ncbi:MAG: tyrosine-protein phosphatase [Pseudomonadota bacterium]